MSLLFAQLEYQIRRTAATVGRAIVEKVTGFSDPTGRQLPDDELCDWQRDAAGLAKAEDHSGYYDKTPTCARQLSAIDGVLHACYRDPDHAHDPDHGCLCGRTWRTPTQTSAVSPTAVDDPAADWPAAGSPLDGMYPEPSCGEHTGNASNRCLLIDGHHGPHDDDPPLTVPAGLRREGASPAGLAIPAIPGICQVLAEHRMFQDPRGPRIYCGTDLGGFETHGPFEDRGEWREHVASLIFAQFFTKPQQ